MPKQEDLKRGEPKYPEQVVTIVTDIPKSVNHAYINTPRGGKKLRKDVEKWMESTKKSVMQQLREQGFKPEFDDVWWYIDCVFYFPDLRIRDNHNTFKVLFDTIEGTFFKNDYFVMPRVQGCYLDRENPRLVMTVRPQGGLK